MNTKKKRAVLECCCGVCVGCCTPVDYTNPLYPGGVVEDVPFEFVAPNCPELDGDVGFFDPINPTGSVIGSCGPCGSFLGQNVAVLAGARKNPVVTCELTPCSIQICLILECDPGQSSIPGLDFCCSRLRLWIGTTETQAEDDGSRPLGATSLDCTSWKKVNPTQCSCAGGLSARFPFAINFVCPKYTVGPCAGEDNCCKVTCDLTNAEVVL